jgi:hypothetical protein
MAESKSNMRIEMGPVDLGGKFHAMYTLHNAWNSEISKYRTECHFNRVMDDKGSGFIVGTSDKNAVSRKSWIESAIPSGAGATERCFTDYMAFNGPVVCTDVTVDMEYQLTSYPSQTIRKSQRFVVARGNGPHWFEELVDTPGDYCTGGYR